MNAILFGIDITWSISNHRLEQTANETLTLFRNVLSAAPNAANIRVMSHFFCDLPMFGDNRWNDVNRAGFVSLPVFNPVLPPRRGFTPLYNVLIECKNRIIQFGETFQGLNPKRTFVMFSDGVNTLHMIRRPEGRDAVNEMHGNGVSTVFLGYGTRACDVGTDLGFQTIVDVKAANNIVAVFQNIAS